MENIGQLFLLGIAVIAAIVAFIVVIIVIS